MIRMTKINFCFALVLMVSVLGGCNHSTNNTPAPTGSGISIVSPNHQSYVAGIVNVSVDAHVVDAEIVKIYIDGKLYETCTNAPWQCTWNTATLPSNSSHVIKAIAYNKVNSYTSTQEVVVRIK
jgi:hypothetical protein